MKIVFMGTPNFAVPTLEKLINSEHDVVAVYTKEPKKVDRGQRIKKTAVQKIAEENMIDVFTPKNFGVKEKCQLLESNPDICVVVAYGVIIPLDILNLPRYGFLNVHASLLPRWRGADPIRRAILEGDSVTGVSIMQMNEELDKGDILANITVSITGKNTRYENLYEELAEQGAKLVLNVLSLIENNPKAIKKIKQNDDLSTYAKKIKKGDGKIDWTKSAEKVFGQIMALSVSPGVYFEYKGERIKVFDAEVEKNFNFDTASNKRIPGTVIESTSDSSCAKFCVLCGKGVVSLHKLQRSGKNAMYFREFLRGFPIKVGEVLE